VLIRIRAFCFCRVLAFYLRGFTSCCGILIVAASSPERWSPLKFFTSAQGNGEKIYNVVIDILINSLFLIRFQIQF